MRHGEAEIEIGLGLDSCRRLSFKGREQTTAQARTWLQHKPPTLASYRSPLTRASQTADVLISQFPEWHFNVADWLLPTANSAGGQPQLEKISRLPGFNEPFAWRTAARTFACGAQSDAQWSLDPTARRRLRLSVDYGDQSAGLSRRFCALP